MNRVFIVLAVIVGLTTLVIGLGSCDKLQQIKGMVAGRVQTSGGRGVGYVSVSLVNVENGSEVDRMTAEESGSFIFRDVDAAKYTIKIYSVGGSEIPSQVDEFSLTPGRTMNIDVIMIDQE